uniref:Uncharacterized protein n=1 Tax=Magnetococcus massalia (strain MO-1) TaxID=451514 RepID=A0A1S7LKY1_MAGMO|nr:Conserved exported protein of unknown function [Candidatus Magnetococcus massalia]
MVTRQLLTALLFTAMLAWLATPSAYSAPPASGSELIYSDDFERQTNTNPDKQWHMTRMHGVGCGRVDPAYRQPQHLRGVVPPAVQIVEGALTLTETSSGVPIQSYKVFNRPIKRLAFDFTPLNVMGGPDDRAWIGARIQFMDDANVLLGELWHYYFNRHYQRPTNTPTRYAVAVQGSFDGVKRRLSIEVDELARRHLKGMDPDRVARTLVIFELGAGWCGSDISGSFDNVQLFSGISPEYTLTQKEILAIGRSVQLSFLRDRSHFPLNWMRRVRAKHQPSRVDKWLDAVEKKLRERPKSFTQLVERMSGVSDERIFPTAFAVKVMLDNRRMAGLDSPVEGPFKSLEPGKPAQLQIEGRR